MKEITNIIYTTSIDTKSNSLVDLAKNNLISINQCDLLTQNLTQKIAEFSNELDLLEKQFKSIKDVYSEDQPISYNKNRKSAFIDSAEYTDNYLFLDEKEKNQENTERDEFSPMSITHANGLLAYMRKQIKTHEWEVRGVGKYGSLFDSITDSRSQKKTIQCTTFITTHYAGKMIEVLNASTLCPENEIKSCTTAVEKVKNITNDALLAVSVFRANTTHIAYRNLHEDLDNFQQLLQSNRINEISEQIDVLMDEHITTNGVLKFETRCRKIKEKNLPVIDKLIKFYFVAKDFLYHKNLSNAEREYLYCIVLMLKETDVTASLDNIKNEIMTRTKNNTWIMPAGGGSIINIDKIKYKVPDHVQQMWIIFEEASEHELAIFSNRYNFSSYQMLSQILRIAHHAVFHVPISRNKDSQSFYLDMLTGKYFITLERGHLLSCQK
jgi:hypothetical protein